MAMRPLALLFTAASRLVAENGTRSMEAAAEIAAVSNCFTRSFGVAVEIELIERKHLGLLVERQHLMSSLLNPQKRLPDRIIANYFLHLRLSRESFPHL